MTEIIYTQTRYAGPDGAQRVNPRFFTEPDFTVSKVYIVGDWPKIEAAYRYLDIPVVRLDAQPFRAPQKAVTWQSRAVPADECGKVYIPADWRSLNFKTPKAGRDLTLAGIAAMLSDEPIINRDVAVRVIEAELKRRKADEEGSNGLTRREMNADLEARGAEIDPGLTIEELAALHGAVKGK